MQNHLYRVFPKLGNTFGRQVNESAHSPRLTACGPSRLAAVCAALVVASGVTIGLAPTAGAAVTTVKGSACGYITNVGLFGGPQSKLGCDPQQGTSNAPASTSTLSPSVALSPDGSNSPQAVTDADGASARYGPARIFGGIWPPDVASGPPSGPISVRTEGTPASGTVTASTDIVLRSPPDPAWPGGFRGAGSWGAELHSTCSASPTGVTGSATFVDGVLMTTTDAEGAPKDTEAIPDNPPVNYTRSGVITNVGDVFTTVFNQHIFNPDGSLTVNAVHVYLFGPTAVGEVIMGQVTCGTTPAAAATSDTVAPGCGPLIVQTTGPDDPTPRTPRTELIGVFDAGTGATPSGLQSITNVVATNATVVVGNPDPSYPAYTHFVPGQTGPLQITASRLDESMPMSWSFDATDAAGNVTHSSQCPTETAMGGGSTGGGSTGGGSTGGGSTGGGSTGGSSGGDPTGGDPTSGDPTSGDPTSGDPTSGDPTSGSGTSKSSGEPGTLQGAALARTGFNTQPLIFLATASLVAGGLAVAGSRRRVRKCGAPAPK